MSAERKLIFLVQNYDFLYNKSSNNFKNKIANENAWQEISKELKIDANDCKKKWQYIRQQYCKYLDNENKSCSGQGAKPKNNFPYALELQFMKMHVKKRKLFGTPSFAEDTANDNDDNDTGFSSNRDHLEESFRPFSAVDELNIETDIEANYFLNKSLSSDEEILAMTMNDINKENQSQASTSKSGMKRNRAHKLRKNNDILENKLINVLDVLEKKKAIENECNTSQNVKEDVKHFTNMLVIQLSTISDIKKRMNIMVKLSSLLVTEMEKLGEV